MPAKTKFRLVMTVFFSILLLSSCSRLGYGVLLWSTEDPPIPSGTVLPVYIRSNIERLWVVGVPEEYRQGKGGIDKIEIPIARLEMAGSKAKAQKMAEEFAEYAHVYAENLQDGLPIREFPDNGSRRVYRLRLGEVIKILEKAEGNPAISTTGDPLPGDWYKVLTGDGAIGYCFSYRLNIFDHFGGPLMAAPAKQEEIVQDPDLDNVFNQQWSPESYQLMVSQRRINISELERHYGFDPGQDTGIARIYIPGTDRTFSYTSIKQDGEKAWRFEGTNLQMNLRTNNSLAVQFVESTGGMRTLLFVALPSPVDDLILQENARRENLYESLRGRGPVFTSNNFGTITLYEGGNFTWTGYDLLVPEVIPKSVTGKGRVSMDIFLTPSFEDRYTGACTFRFVNSGGGEFAVCFMYFLDNYGLRLEIAPDYTIEDVTVTRRSSSPLVMYFFRDE